VITKRFQGLSGKFHKTHQIVLTKRINFWVRSEKLHELDLDLRDLIY
jgi:hypothetical protein